MDLGSSGCLAPRELCRWLTECSIISPSTLSPAPVLPPQSQEPNPNRGLSRVVGEPPEESNYQQEQRRTEDESRRKDWLLMSADGLLAITQGGKLLQVLQQSLGINCRKSTDAHHITALAEQGVATPLFSNTPAARATNWTAIFSICYNHIGLAGISDETRELWMCGDTVEILTLCSRLRLSLPTVNVNQVQAHQKELQQQQRQLTNNRRHQQQPAMSGMKPSSLDAKSAAEFQQRPAQRKMISGALVKGKPPHHVGPLAQQPPAFYGGGHLQLTPAPGFPGGANDQYNLKVAEQVTGLATLLLQQQQMHQQLHAQQLMFQQQYAQQQMYQQQWYVAQSQRQQEILEAQYRRAHGGGGVASAHDPQEQLHHHDNKMGEQLPSSGLGNRPTDPANWAHSPSREWSAVSLTGASVQGTYDLPQHPLRTSSESMASSSESASPSPQRQNQQQRPAAQPSRFNDSDDEAESETPPVASAAPATNETKPVPKVRRKSVGDTASEGANTYTPCVLPGGTVKIPLPRLKPPPQTAGLSSGPPAPTAERAPLHVNAQRTGHANTADADAQNAQRRQRKAVADTTTKKQEDHNNHVEQPVVRVEKPAPHHHHPQPTPCTPRTRVRLMREAILYRIRTNVQLRRRYFKIWMRHTLAAGKKRNQTTDDAPLLKDSGETKHLQRRKTEGMTNRRMNAKTKQRLAELEAEQKHDKRKHRIAAHYILRMSSVKLALISFRKWLTWFHIVKDRRPVIPPNDGTVTPRHSVKHMAPPTHVCGNQPANSSASPARNDDSDVDDELDDENSSNATTIFDCGSCGFKVSLPQTRGVGSWCEQCGDYLRGPSLVTAMSPKARWHVTARYNAYDIHSRFNLRLPAIIQAVIVVQKHARSLVSFRYAWHAKAGENFQRRFIREDQSTEVAAPPSAATSWKHRTKTLHTVQSIDVPLWMILFINRLQYKVACKHGKLLRSSKVYEAAEAQRSPWYKRALLAEDARRRKHASPTAHHPAPLTKKTQPPPPIEVVQFGVGTAHQVCYNICRCLRCSCLVEMFRLRLPIRRNEDTSSLDAPLAWKRHTAFRFIPKYEQWLCHRGRGGGLVAPAKAKAQPITTKPPLGAPHKYARRSSIRYEHEVLYVVRAQMHQLRVMGRIFHFIAKLTLQPWPVRWRDERKLARGEEVPESPALNVQQPSLAVSTTPSNPKDEPNRDELPTTTPPPNAIQQPERDDALSLSSRPSSSAAVGDHPPSRGEPSRRPSVAPRVSVLVTDDPEVQALQEESKMLEKSLFCLSTTFFIDPAPPEEDDVPPTSPSKVAKQPSTPQVAPLGVEASKQPLPSSVASSKPTSATPSTRKSSTPPTQGEPTAAMNNEYADPPPPVNNTEDATRQKSPAPSSAEPNTQPKPLASIVPPQSNDDGRTSGEKEEEAGRAEDMKAEPVAEPSRGRLIPGSLVRRKQSQSNTAVAFDASTNESTFRLEESRRHDKALQAQQKMEASLSQTGDGTFRLDDDVDIAQMPTNKQHPTAQKNLPAPQPQASSPKHKRTKSDKSPKDEKSRDEKKSPSSPERPFFGFMEESSFRLEDPVAARRQSRRSNSGKSSNNSNTPTGQTLSKTPTPTHAASNKQE